MKYFIVLMILLPYAAYNQMTTAIYDANGNLVKESKYPNGYAFFKFTTTFCKLSIEYDVMDSNSDSDFSQNYEISGTPELIWLKENYAIKILLQSNKEGLSRIYLTKIDQSSSIHLFYENNTQLSLIGLEVHWYM